MTSHDAPHERPGRRRRPHGVDRGPRRLADSLEDAVAGLSPPARPNRPPGDTRPPRADVLGSVFAGWEEIVGAPLARHVWPLTLADGVLAVAVDQPAWATHVRALGATILQRVGEVAGEVPSELRVVVRPGGPPP